MNDFLDYRENYLAHYGVKGMKWGKRKRHHQTLDEADLARRGPNAYTEPKLRTQSNGRNVEYVEDGWKKVRHVEKNTPEGNRRSASFRRSKELSLSKKAQKMANKSKARKFIHKILNSKQMRNRPD